MKCVKFTLSGKTAFFKKPEVNSYINFTYGHVHKMSLLGIFGAILGYDGYGQKQWKSKEKCKEKKEKLVEEFPEFYERLKDVKVSIVPQNDKGYISKKVQMFNNSVGYASKEQGGNLIVKEQWLEEPKWDIYVLVTNEETEELAKQLCEQKCVYMPYLGKNDHPADIKKTRLIDIQESQNEVVVLASLFPKASGEISDEMEPNAHSEFRYEEKLPVGLDAMTNFYLYDTFVYTNYALENLERTVYEVDNEGKMTNLVFY